MGLGLFGLAIQLVYRSSYLIYKKDVKNGVGFVCVDHSNSLVT